MKRLSAVRLLATQGAGRRRRHGSLVENPRGRHCGQSEEALPQRLHLRRRNRAVNFAKERLVDLHRPRAGRSQSVQEHQRLHRATH